VCRDFISFFFSIASRGPSSEHTVDAKLYLNGGKAPVAMQSHFEGKIAWLFCALNWYLFLSHGSISDGVHLSRVGRYAQYMRPTLHEGVEALSSKSMSLNTAIEQSFLIILEHSFHLVPMCDVLPICTSQLIIESILQLMSRRRPSIPITSRPTPYPCLVRTPAPKIHMP
jgi:hypothetical protein